MIEHEISPEEMESRGVVCIVVDGKDVPLPLSDAWKMGLGCIDLRSGYPAGRLAIESAKAFLATNPTFGGYPVVLRKPADPVHIGTDLSAGKPDQTAIGLLTSEFVSCKTGPAAVSMVVNGEEVNLYSDPKSEARMEFAGRNLAKKMGLPPPDLSALSADEIRELYETFEQPTAPVAARTYTKVKCRKCQITMGMVPSGETWKGGDLCHVCKPKVEYREIRRLQSEAATEAAGRALHRAMRFG